jgi:hypothetical protein
MFRDIVWLISVGAKLARDCFLSFNIDVDWTTAIASKLCSYRAMCVVHLAEGEWV